jgi:rhodanese-related sulfurtransferase
MEHSSGFLKLVNDAKTRVKQTDVAATKAWMDAGEDFYLVDVREEGEWARGHLPGAMWIGKGILERDVEKKIPDKNAKIVLYCGGGFRSTLAGDNLQKMGYTNVLSMDGGWRGWTEAGYPTQED